MTYELAKRLKDAGFPQLDPAVNVRRGYFVVPATSKAIQNRRVHKGAVTPTQERAYIPTSEELIEELGEKFKMLSLHGDGPRFYAGGGKLLRVYDDIGHHFEFAATGDTPLEALAELYIAIHQPIERK